MKGCKIRREGWYKCDLLSSVEHASASVRVVRRELVTQLRSPTTGAQRWQSVSNASFQVD